MKIVQLVGVSIALLSVSFLLAGGGGIPKREDVPKYLAQLKSASGTDRAKAAEMLGKRGGINVSDVEPAIEPLKKMLDVDKDARVRAAAARALGAIQADAEGTVPLLIKRLRAEEEQKDVKMAAVVALGQYGPEAKEALQPLRDYLKKFDAKKSKDGQTIQNAIMTISQKKKKKG
ncbi:MAG TPA: HEAT repeat domain-containing protein [Gemmataceae bacterium]|nr:HEAT repeat domain-containing protein [Gemmataceae bacterium]